MKKLIINYGEKVSSIMKNIENIARYIILYLINDQKNISKLPILSNEKFLIVGNGPSAREVNFNKISDKNINIVCVNDFAFQNESFFQIKPKYYCVIDPAYYEKSDYINETNKLIKSLNNVDWMMTYICLRNQNLSELNNPHIHVVHLNTNQYCGKWWKYYLYSKNKANFGYLNVIHAALYFCLTARANEIYLTGVESDWHREIFIDENNNLLREYRHFYGVNKVNLTDKGISKKGEYYKYIGFYYKTMKEFYSAKSYADYLGAKVYNLTLSSYIDVFEKKKIVL